MGSGLGAHFAKMTPNYGFLVAFGVIHVPLFFELWGIPEQVMTLKVCILTPNFLSLVASGVIYDP